MAANSSCDLKIVHWNCFQLTNKLFEFDVFLNKLKPDIVSINETKMTEESANYHLRFAGYTAIFKSRKIRGEFGGGVAILIKDTIKFEVVKEFDKFNLEMVALQVFDGRKKILIASYYNPKKLNCYFFKLVKEKFKDFIILGDINAHSTLLGDSVSNTNGKILENILMDGCFIIANDVSQPTYIGFNQDKKSVLDVCICSPFLWNKITEFKILSNDNMGSDHLPLFVNFSGSPLSKTCAANIKYSGEVNFKYEKADWESFKSELDIYAPYIPPNDEIELLNKFFVDSVYSAAQKSIPGKSNSISINYRKKFPKEILEIINFRKAVKKELDILKKANIFDRALKKTYNSLTQEFKKAKSKFENEIMQNLIDRVGPNPTSSRQFWARINSFRKPASNKASGSLISNNLEFVEPKDKANLFAKRLETIYSASNFDSNFDRIFFASVNSNINTLINKDSAHGGNLQQSSSFDMQENISLNDVQWHLKRLRNSKSTGFDKISNIMLKNLNHSFVNLLHKIVNIAFKTAVLPIEWKKNKIIMIPKKYDGDLKDPDNYRPLSLTSSIAKLVERIIENHLNRFISHKNIIVPYQSGFRVGRSTHDNLFYLTQKISENISQNQRSCAIFFDISKAFDKVWHNGLLFKLDKLGVSKTIKKWIASFLSNRFGFVSVDGVYSELVKIETGVPQGSVLGPLLLSLYINDIPSRCVIMIKIFLYCLRMTLCLFLGLETQGKLMELKIK